MLKLLADENIPQVHEAFGAFGTVTTMRGRDIGPAEVAHQDVLLVRSVTRVDDALLHNSSVQFVGTATIGVDHIDLQALEARGIGFASCPGSNAESVACYVTCALLELAERLGLRLADSTLGVVGVGNVGRRVVTKAKALGMKVLCNDPPRARREPEGSFVPLNALLRGSDMVTLHTPLTRTGPDATYRLINAETLAQLRPGAALLNSGRGDVVDEAALRQALHSGHVGAAALDVWANEPRIDGNTLALVELATPHIAGYAIDGKVRGTTMLTEALANWLEQPNPWDPQPHLRTLPAPSLHGVGDGQRSLEDELRSICRQANHVRGDDRRLREALAVADGPRQRGSAFDRLRKTYPLRREFGQLTVFMATPNTALVERLEALGFDVQSRPNAP
ncbi:MAG: 4-phosphoerythronate dehydrogenase [Myxococcota bacterium]